MYTTEDLIACAKLNNITLLNEILKTCTIQSLYYFRRSVFFDRYIMYRTHDGNYQVDKKY